MKNKKIEKLIAGEDKDFLSGASKEKENFGSRMFNAEVVFFLLDFLESQQPKMKKKQFAEKMGVKPQYINKLLKGESNFQLDTLEKMAHEMNLSFGDFMSQILNRMNTTDSIVDSSPRVEGTL